MKETKSIYGYTAKQIIEESQGFTSVNLWLKKGGFKSLEIIAQTNEFILLVSKDETFKVFK
jgi:hypothetical protein